MKFTPLALAAIAASSFGIATTAVLLTDSPALADRPGYYPHRPHTGGDGGYHPGTPSRPTSDGQAGQLKGASPETQILVYPQPDADAEPIGYGFAGDDITVQDTVSNGSWYYVQFAASGARGWVQGQYVSIN
ncbi:MAG: SH3 domain-containing protein [Thainema sp.]